jgi:hypothetical protein
MAIITSGPFLGFVGTVNGITYYTDKYGRTIAKRKNGPRKVPASKKQVAVMNDTIIIAEFMQPLRLFVPIGYGLEAAATQQNPYNAMVPGLRKKALTGIDADRKIDYSKVLMTKGKMTAALNASVQNVAKGFRFQWDTTEMDSSTHWSDQVILLAYFPALSEVRFLGAGSERHAGEAQLDLIGTKKGFLAEVYIAFVSSNRKSISDSTYLGQLNW